MAVRVVRDDNQVDLEYRSALRELITYMMEDPRSISRVMNILWRCARWSASATTLTQYRRECHLFGPRHGRAPYLAR